MRGVNGVSQINESENTLYKRVKDYLMRTVNVAAVATVKSIIVNICTKFVSAVTKTGRKFAVLSALTTRMVSPLWESKKVVVPVFRLMNSFSLANNWSQYRSIPTLLLL